MVAAFRTQLPQRKLPSHVLLRPLTFSLSTTPQLSNCSYLFLSLTQIECIDATHECNLTGLYSIGGQSTTHTRSMASGVLVAYWDLCLSDLTPVKHIVFSEHADMYGPAVLVSGNSAYFVCLLLEAVHQLQADCQCEDGKNACLARLHVYDFSM